MKQAFLFFLLSILSSSPLYAQRHEEDKYFSSEQKAYYDARPNPFEPVSREKILSFRLPHVTVRELRVFTPYKRITEKSLEQEEQQWLELLHSRKDATHATPEENPIGFNQPFIFPKKDLSGKQAYLYMNNMLDEAWTGVWLALYEEESGQWRKYYTGLAQGEPLFLKRYSGLPLFKDSVTLQVEAAFLREVYSDQDSGFVHEVVKDGVVVELDLAAITADTDGDGLTDVVEAKMGLNPALQDTDGDGITDSHDLNPRFRPLHTELTPLFEALLSGTLPPAYEGFRKVPPPSKENALDVLPQADVATMLIVSDSRHVQGLVLADERVIILGSKEYVQHKATYPSSFSQYHFTPLFQVDGMKDTFRFSFSDGPSGTEYLVRKGKDGWVYKVLTAWID